MKRIAVLAPLSALALGLSACGGGAEEEAPAVETNLSPVEEATPAPVMNIETEAPPATRIDNSTAEQLPSAPTLSADEQTQEDADATGMTARVDRSESTDTGEAGQTSQPAQ